MTPTVSTTSVLHLQPHSRVTLWGFVGRHIHALSDETLRRALTHLDTSDLRRVAQVCVRWRGLALPSVSGCGALPCPASLLPWNVLLRVFALLSSVDCRNAARVCASWRLNALCFFSPVLGKRHINDLPGELLDYIFSYLDFEDLRMAAQVCLHWRDHGIDHPTFWRNIEATSVTAGALDLLAARLGQSRGRPFSLTVDIEPPLRPAAEKRLMNLITAIMPTVQKLDIRLDAFCAVSLWPVLNWDAPEMTKFSLRLYNPDRIMARIPINSGSIFDGLPGKLREVFLKDVLLPMPHDGFPAFSQLERLTIIHPPGTTMSFPTYFFEICRNLHTLELSSGRLTFDKPWSPAALEGLSRLTRLVIHLDPLARNEFVARMPLLKHIPYVVMTPPPDIDAVYDVLDGVCSPFNVGLFYSRPHEFCLLVEDDRSGYRRTFLESVESYARGPTGNDQVNPLLENDEFPQQVRFLSVSLCLWDMLVPYISHFTGIAKLVINLFPPDHFSVVQLSARPLAFAALEVLVIEAFNGHCGLVRPGEAIHLVDDILQAHNCRKLELHNVLLYWKDDPHPLYRRFDHVTYPLTLHSRPIIRHANMLM